MTFLLLVFREDEAAAGAGAVDNVQDARVRQLVINAERACKGANDKGGQF